jgi:hypothetical protein
MFTVGGQADVFKNMFSSFVSPYYTSCCFSFIPFIALQPFCALVRTLEEMFSSTDFLKIFENSFF